MNRILSLQYKRERRYVKIKIKVKMIIKILENILKNKNKFLNKSDHVKLNDKH